MKNLLGGTLSFHILQNFFSFDSKCSEECKYDFEKNFYYKVLENNLFYVQTKKQPVNKKPILIFFGGLGVKNVHYRLKQFLDYNCKCINTIIFSMHMNNIHDINEMIQKGVKLYEYGKKMFPENEFIFAGHSLGSGIAAQTCNYILSNDSKAKIKGVILISTYPNLSYTFEKTFFKNIINFAFNNILDNEKAISELKQKIEKTNFIKIIQGDNDKIFQVHNVQSMIKKHKLESFVKLKIIEGDHFYPAEFEIWCDELCSF